MNRRLTHTLGDGRVEFTTTGAEVQVIPLELCELPLLRGFEDREVLEALANRFEQRDFGPGEMIVEAGRPADQLVLIAHGKVSRIGRASTATETMLGVLADGDHFGAERLVGEPGNWDFTLKAVTSGTVLTLAQESFEEVFGRSDSLRAHVGVDPRRPGPAAARPTARRRSSWPPGTPASRRCRARSWTTSWRRASTS